MRVFMVFAVLAAVGALIGYTTKWVSTKLIFHPARFVGIGPLGWQGVVQRRSPKFAAGIADMLEGIVPVEEVVGRLHPEEFADVAGEALQPVLADLAPELLNTLRSGLWDEAPPEVRVMLTEMLGQQARDAVAEMVTEALPILATDIDVKPMIVEMLSGENADRLAVLTQTITAREMRVVIRYGAVVGFFVGIVEAVAFLVFDRWWLLPAVGALDGLVNNWMGIQMIFRPLQPRRYFGLFRYQGLFPARQSQIAHDYGEVMAADVLTPRALADHIARSPAHEQLAKIVHDVLDRRLGAQLTLMGPALGVEPTSDLRERVVRTAMAALGADADRVLPDLADYPGIEAYVAHRIQIAQTIKSKLGEMSKVEFETVVRGIFEEDEKTLIAVGGVLGALIGTRQAVLVLALGLG